MNAPHPASRAKVLLIEDDLVLLQTMGHVLKWNEFDIQLCGDGESGLEAALAWQPDLILLDLVLPGIDGFEVLSKLKSSPATRNIPVVVITGYSGEQSARRAEGLGAAAYLAKPMRAQELVRKVEAWLGRAE